MRWFDKLMVAGLAVVALVSASIDLFWWLRR